MAQRRYGPTRGAGVAIIELEGDKSLTPGALGWIGHAGIYEKGDVGKLLQCFTAADFKKKLGGYIADSIAPDSAAHFFQLANGAGGGMFVRVTDGNEVPATITLYGRKATRTAVGRLDAHNGGRWGGKKKSFTGDWGSNTITQTTLPTGITMKHDQWKGGKLTLAGVNNKTYTVIGNSAAGVVTVSADATMVTDLGVSTSKRFYLELDNDDSYNPRGGRKCLSVLIQDGEDSPDTEFKIVVLVDGNTVDTYANLSNDPASTKYWVNVINNDPGNDEVTATDLLVGSPTADKRPANVYGTSGVLVALVLTAVISEFAVTNSPGGGNPTFLLGTTNDTMLEQVITLTMSSATAFAAVSDKFGSLGSGTFGSLFTPSNKYSPPFTVTAGGTACASGDTLQIVFKPFIPSSLIGGRVYPDKVNQKRMFFRITANDHKTITVAAGSDLTNNGGVTAGAEFLVETPLEFQGGIDGIADLTDTSYTQQAWDTSASPFNQTDGKSLGLVKFATPGVTATAVQKAGTAYAEAKNHQYRQEIPSNVVDEATALAQVNDTVGRSDFAVVEFPSYIYVPDPVAITPGKLKLVSATGAIHGREARTAVDNNGFHKAAAGIDQTLPMVLKIPTTLGTSDKPLNEEILNPAGINIIKKLHGNYVLWGDRTLFLDPTWKFKHQREQMSRYEHDLQEQFDFIVFAINDPITDKIAIAALRSYFLPEWQQRALRGDTFEQACLIKIDSENNTNLSRGNGDENAIIKLRLADTVERFVISISKAGLFESLA